MWWSSPSAAKLIVCAWFLWFHRNSFTFGGELKDIPTLLVSVSRCLEEWKHKVVVAKQKRPRDGGVWKAPSSGWVKINFDGALFADQCSSRAGVVIRNDEGLVLAAMSSKEQSLKDPVLIEGLAVLRAISLAIDLGYQYVVLEGDSLATI